VSSRKDKTETEAAKPAAWREYAEALLVAVLLAFFIRSFVVQAFKIPSGSMLPTLEIGDHLLVNKFLYGIRVPFIGGRILDFKDPERNDVVVFIYPRDRSKDFIKRVVALGGDTIEVRNKRLFINGERAEDPFGVYGPDIISRRRGPRDNFGPFTVPEGEVFVMGDNRDASHDSRFWGTVPVTEILGKAFVLYWSWDAHAFSPRWSRIGDRIP